MTNSAFDDWFEYLLHSIFLFVDAIQTLLSFPRKGIWIDPTVELRKLTVKELKEVLEGQRTYNLRKDELISLVLKQS